MKENNVFGQHEWTSASIITMSEGERENLHIDYEIYDTPFGRTLIASTHEGVCYVAFGDDAFMVSELSRVYRDANRSRATSEWQLMARLLITGNGINSILPLHIYGTEFQINVWRTLLRIPDGKRTTYKAIASIIGRPKAIRAVGTAVGDNPVSYIIPCHRVVRSDGKLGGYHWGLDTKEVMLSHESPHA